MIQTCRICAKLIQEGDRVQILVTSTYHLLKSTTAYALDKVDMTAYSETLCHLACTESSNE